MKILITCLSKSWGGLEMYTLLTANQLKKRDLDVELLCCSGSRFNDEAIKGNFKIYNSDLKKIIHPFEIFALAEILRRNKYDIIHAGRSQDLWLLVPAIKLSKTEAPLILSKHMGSYIIKKDFLHKWIYSRVTYALAISNVIKQNLVDTTPLQNKNILLLHNGIDTNKFNPEKVDRTKIRSEFDISENELLIGMIARFSPGKGHEEFLMAAQSLLSKHNNLRFIIVGEPSEGETDYGNKIKSLAEELNITDKIIFTGYRKDTPEILAAMDIFVFPSHAEAFGLALTEAMSMEKPSVCSNSDGVLDIAVDGVTSYLFQKQNWIDLDKKIEQLLISPQIRINFGKEARKRVKELFDIEVFTDNLINIYKSTQIK